MGNIDSILLPNEVVVYRTKRHWIVYASAAALVLLALLCYALAINEHHHATARILGATASATTAENSASASHGSNALAKRKAAKKAKSDSDSDLSDSAAAVAGRVAEAPIVHSFIYSFCLYAGHLFLLLGFISALLAWVRTVAIFAVTNKRVYIRQGLIAQTSFEILLKKAEGIGLDQPLWGRILNYGTIVYAGAGNRESFPRVANAVEFRRQIALASDNAQV